MPSHRVNHNRAHGRRIALLRRAGCTLLMAFIIVAPTVGCDPATATTVIIFAAAAGSVVVVVTQVYEAESAKLDVERKTLEIEALRRDGTSYRKTIELNAAQFSSLRDAKEVTVQLESGEKKGIPLAKE